MTLPCNMIVDISVIEPGWSKVDDVDRVAKIAAQAAYTMIIEDPSQVTELSLVLANNNFVRKLNKRYRGKDGPTNVLSFPANDQTPPAPGLPQHLGDIVVALEVTEREAVADGKTLENHLCHLVVHGVLHLLGHDHQNTKSAARMEKLEIAALHKLGVPNPYERDSEGRRMLASNVAH